MSGTGKSEATNFLKDQFNFDLFYFGGIVLNEVKKRGLEINNENEKMVREDLRRQHGNGVLAKRKFRPLTKTEVDRRIGQNSFGNHRKNRFDHSFGRPL